MVKAYTREMGIFDTAPGSHTSLPAPEHQIYPYLLRAMTAEHPNHIWGIDITCTYPMSPLGGTETASPYYGNLRVFCKGND
jgi:hypothetical protein